MKALIDTCIIIDALQERIPFAENAKKIFIASANRHFDGFITAKSIADIYYLIHRYTHSDAKT
ncbi:PIN domain-containing protein, partial [uncultured Clostridium sp.]|uniref:PIN domain-containing protein n=1 Tax=uncultured Clostridium sp. TaxID=59620 RepID=UPI0025EC3162